MRFLPVSLTTILVELADLDETLALFASLQNDRVEGIEETVPAARTLMIRFRPETIGVEALAARLASRDLSAKIAPSDNLVEIPVHYNGEDLADVAELTGMSIEEVIHRHTLSEFTVAFCGFAPGFGYLVGGDPALHVPRRQSPRTRIPAGSVALAGAFSGVYPQNSPGGWQIIGTVIPARCSSRGTGCVSSTWTRPAKRSMFRHRHLRKKNRKRTARISKCLPRPCPPSYRI